jgi:hypothetical protein
MSVQKIKNPANLVSMIVTPWPRARHVPEP